MRQRIIAGLVALPLFLIPIWLGGWWAALLLVAVGVGGGIEVYRLMELGGYQPSRIFGVVWLAALILSYWLPQVLPLSLIIMAGLIITLIKAMRQKQAPMHTWMATSMGALYLGTMIGQALALRMLPAGLWWLLLALVVTWINDTAAYFTGVTVGRHPFWPRISPKKTWEGSIGGWIGAAIVGLIMVMVTPLSATYSPLFGFVLGACCGILALFGDLSISILKRQVGVKDTGNFLPGHGGILDRTDSLLFVIPFVYQMVVLWG